jgi:excisionase family DNA binding protein
VRWSEKLKLFIPYEEVERFECKNGLKASQMPATLVTVSAMPEQSWQEQLCQSVQRASEQLRQGCCCQPSITPVVEAVEPGLTVKEAAAYSRVDEKTIRRWLKKNPLKGYKTPGGQWRIPQLELDQFRIRNT